MKFSSANPKQSFPEIEERVLAYWKEHSTFQKSIDTRSEANPYRFYDGPPFITGTPHYGSLLSSVVKDIVPRYWTMQGKRVERKWGWDCHGIPIEDKVQKKLGLESSKDVEKIGIKKFIEECYSYTQSTSAEWEWYIDHIGRWVDFDGAYRTMDNDYMETVLWVFKQFCEKDLVYEGKRVSLYSTKLSTPISNFEVAMDNSYEDVNDPAITVSFDLSKNGGKWQNLHALAWTTTPWTMPAHICLAINENITYTKVACGDKFYVVAKNRIEAVFKGKEFEVLEDIAASELHGLAYQPPFDFYIDKINPELDHCIHYADFVNDEDGTGIAHEAPEFGDVDFSLAKEKGLYITEAMDKEGKYTAQIAGYEGMFYRDANPIMTEELAKKGILFKKEGITHRVAICPRTGLPLVYKAQKSWFINIQSLKEKLIAANEEINWFPDHFKHGRFLKSMEGAPDWCISRTRYWATPMPVWIGRDANGVEQDRKIFGSKAEIEAASGMKVTDLHRPFIDEITWSENGLTYTRVEEVLDVWLDSGSMPYAQMHYPFENKAAMENSFPADFIVEYVGQIRAWFYVMHVVGVSLFDKRAFSNVITTGTIYGTDGRKMSKSYGNYPDPRAVLQKFGGDTVRFYLANSPLLSGNDINFSEEALVDVTKKVILPLWNAYSFFSTYANIDDFEPNTTQLFFMRHGECDGNVGGNNISLTSDPELNANGIEQVKARAVEFAKKQNRFDIIVTSNKKRAIQSAQILAENLGYEVAIEVVDSALLSTNIEEGHRYVCEKYNGKNVLMVGHYEGFSFLEKNGQKIAKHNAKVVQFPAVVKHNELDTWVISELEMTLAQVVDAFERYDIQKAAMCVSGFLDNLTNWYIRRSRRRFWRSENDGDKMEAYQTLYEVLVTFCKMAAPFIPFITEDIYQKLTGKESVHLEDYPMPNSDIIDQSLRADMARTQQIVTLGLSLRASKKIRVRQPLASISIVESISDYYQNIICEELNVKKVIILANPKEIGKEICMPNAKKIGPKYGREVQNIITQAKSGNFEKNADGTIAVADIVLLADEYELVYQAADASHDVAAGFGTVIALDTTISRELELEGCARDMIRTIQDARKEAGYQVTDKISLALSGDAIFIETLSSQKALIESETLSTIVESIANPDISKTIDDDGEGYTLFLKR